MRYLTAACPDFSRVLLVESGSRSVLEAAIPRLRGVLGAHVGFDLVTCRPGAPTAFDDAATVWRTQDYTDAEARARLLREAKAAGYTVLAIVCSGEPIMTRWKWWLAWHLPAKVLIVNENADCFWLDTGNLGPLRELASVRLGLAGSFPGKVAAQAAMLPFVLIYLLLYAAAVHVRRGFRSTLTSRL
jgi:hypothetical protein